MWWGAAKRGFVRCAGGHLRRRAEIVQLAAACGVHVACGVAHEGLGEHVSPVPHLGGAADVLG